MFAIGVAGNSNIIKLIIFLIFVLISAFFLFYKLNFVSTFTDEIVYMESGKQVVFENNFEKSREVPILGKYVGVIAYKLSEGNGDIGMARIPYAFMGLISSILVFLILKKQFGFYIGILGGSLYTVAPLIYYSTRMVMLEAQLFLFWLLFHLFFLDYLKSKSRKYLVICGVIFGLALSSKLPTIILFPFSGITYFLHDKYFKKSFSITKYIINLATMYLTAVGTFLSTYVHLLFIEGIHGLKLVFINFYTEYFQWGVSATKKHYILGKHYKVSPSYAYFYYMKDKYNPIHLWFTLISPFIALIKSFDFFTIYWGLFFLISFTLMQSMKIKNGERYAAEFEMSLVFLSVIAILSIAKHFGKKLNIKTEHIILFFFLVLFIPRVYTIIKQKPTGYNAVYQYLYSKTNGFNDDSKIYILASSNRSFRWYFSDIRNLNSSNDRNAFETYEPYFDFLVFDNNESGYNSGGIERKHLRRVLEYYSGPTIVGDFKVYQKTVSKF